MNELVEQKCVVCAYPAKRSAGWTAEYERFIYLIDVFRKLRYAHDELLAGSPFLVQDILFNAILFRADEDLRALAVSLGQPTMR